MRRPAPWASRSAAWETETSMKPLRPRAWAISVRADMIGSSGRGKGIRSITTSRHVEPGTSTPCHSESVPNRLALGSAVNARTSSGIWSSPWHRIGRSTRVRTYSAARSAPRREENSPSAPPPEASTSSASSSSASTATPSRPGRGRWAAT